MAYMLISTVDDIANASGSMMPIIIRFCAKLVKITPTTTKTATEYHGELLFTIGPKILLINSVIPASGLVRAMPSGVMRATMTTMGQMTPWTPLPERR